MDYENNSFTFSNTDLKQASVLICADGHHDIAKVEHTNWIPMRMQHVLVFDPVLASTVQNHGIRAVKIT